MITMTINGPKESSRTGPNRTSSKSTVCRRGPAVATDPDPREIEIPSFNGLGLLHTSVHGEFSRKPCLPCKLEDLQESGATWVLGHVHKPITLSAEPFIGWTGMRAGVHYDPTTSAVSRFS